MKVIDILKNGIHHKNLVNIKDMIFFVEVKEKAQKNDVKVGIGKIKTKHFLSFFQMLAQSQSSHSAKLVYQTLWSSNCRA